jgi:sulfopyruvate decarboxylase subunit beta
MLGSLGLSSSIGLGLALARQGRSRGKVVVIDGDGGVLMNMGSLATIGRYRPDNLVLVIVDNGAYGSTGDQPTATSAGCDLGGVAKGCSIDKAETVSGPAAFAESLKGALAAQGTSVIVAKVSTEKPATAIVPLTGPEIRDRFMEVLREQERSGD